MEPLDFSTLPDVTADHPELEPGAVEYAAHMQARENFLLHVFGVSEPEGKIIKGDDPELWINWPGGGVFQYRPRGKRRGWHYVTHGLSQPFGDQPDDARNPDPGTQRGRGGWRDGPGSGVSVAASRLRANLAARRGRT